MLTQERVKELLIYDPIEGSFEWITPIKKSRKGKFYTGRIGIDKTYFSCYQIAWLYVYGEFPNMAIDHKNRNPNDNRLDNLRLVTSGQNRVNTEKPMSNNKTGVRGVCFEKQTRKYKATICFEGKRTVLGRFKTVEEAKTAYETARDIVHPHFYKGELL
jgi:hypothetical protein